MLDLALRFVEGAGMKVALSWTKWGNTRKRVDLGGRKNES